MGTRRQMILGFGGALIAGAAAGTWRVTRQPETATLPWQTLEHPLADVRLDAFRHAILAPNPHNRQPWLIRLVGTDEAVITCDLAKRLPVTDPFDRQIIIGFGTFLEFTRIAAAERGIALVSEPFPEGEDSATLDARPIARLRFVPSAGLARDPLYAQIVRRHSNKEVYDLTRKVAAAKLAVLCTDGGFATADPARVAALRAEILAAIEAELMTHAPYMESVELMRIGHAEVDANPDGIELTGPMIEAGRLLGMIDRKQLADPTSSAFRQGLEMMRATYGSIPALFWIVTPGNSRADQLEAGRQYVRANLRAAAMGLGMHPMSQSLQEYPEVQPMFAHVHRLLGLSGKERVQMLARVGYGPKTGPTPRWPLEKHLLL